MRRPTVFGKYLLLDRINVGGMAEVFIAKANRPDVGGFLAVKRILPTLAEDDEFISMFIDEARISAQLSHENIIHIQELGKHEDAYFIAMEYVSGRDLRSVLEKLRRRKQRMSSSQAAFIVSKICEGLEYAHRKRDVRGGELNIIHRDVSPQNVLISYDGLVKLIDFGIAKAAIRSQKTQAGILKGKFGYMSPEQVRGLPIDRRTDIFATGVVLYELLTGRRLFVGESDYAVLEKVRNAEIPSPREFNPEVPLELEQVLLKALAREPENRFQWAAELKEALHPFLNKEGEESDSKSLRSFMTEIFDEEYEREKIRLSEYLKQETVGPQEDFSGVSSTRMESLEDGSPNVQDGEEGLTEHSGMFEQDGEGKDGEIVENPVGITVVARVSAPVDVPAKDALLENATRLFRPEDSFSLSGSPDMAEASEVQAVQVPAHKKSPSPLFWTFVFGGILCGAVGAYIFLQPSFGSLLVRVSPQDSLVKVDDQPVDAGHSISLREGAHALYAHSPGFEVYSTRVDILANKEALVDIQLKPVAQARELVAPKKVFQVTLRTVPSGAKVEVDGISVDVTDGAAPLPMREGGNYKIVASLPGYKPLEMDFVPQGEETAKILDLALDPLPSGNARQKISRNKTVVKNRVEKSAGTLVCATKPAGAEVWINGRSTGRKTPVSQGNPLILAEGSHKVVFKLGSRQSGPHVVQIREGEIFKLTNITME